FRDIEGQQPGRPVRLEPLGLPETHPQRHVQQRRQCNNRKTCPNRNFKFQAEMHHHDRSQLAAYREPAHANHRINPDVAGSFSSAGQTKHGANLTNRQRRAKLASARGGISVPIPKFVSVLGHVPSSGAFESEVRSWSAPQVYANFGFAPLAPGARMRDIKRTKLHQEWLQWLTNSTSSFPIASPSWRA